MNISNSARFAKNLGRTNLTALKQLFCFAVKLFELLTDFVVRIVGGGGGAVLGKLFLFVSNCAV